MKTKITVPILFFCIAIVGQTQTKSENLFYMVDTPESFASFEANVDQISIVCPQTFLISKEGVLTGSIDHRVLEIAKKNKIKIMPLIVNKGFDQKLLHDIISNPTSRKRSIEMMLDYADRYNLDGWQFDLEGLHISDKDSYTQYFKETASALHGMNIELSAAVVHIFENVGGPSEYQRFLYEDWRAGFALKELSEIGDFITVMTYDQHTRRTPPGPVAGVEWVEQVVKFMLEQDVSPNKLSMGIPSYSVHWYADYSEEKGGFSNGRQIGYKTVRHLLEKNDVEPSWNEKVGCNYAVWDNGGVFEYIFIEDGQSLERKLDILRKYNLRGISVWVLGSEAPAFWQILKESTISK